MSPARARPTHAALLQEAAQRLAAAGIDTARLDAEVLLAAALGGDRSAVYARLRDPAGDDVATRFAALVDRRVRREPVAYLTGEQEFWSLAFEVSPAVLIPRPETELVVELARERLNDRGGASLEICDIGTGSGCIAVALARELPAARVTAVDVSPEALALAARNAARHGVAERITLVASDLFAALGDARRFDAIVSNPPYLSPDDETSPEVAFEPSGALVSGADGLDVIRRLVAAAPAHLRPGGWLVMEIGATQGTAVEALAAEAALEDVSVIRDLAGLPRVLVARARGGASRGLQRSGRGERGGDAEGEALGGPSSRLCS